MAYHFSQPCPACGRQLRIAVQLLGREVGCQHCGCQFRGGCESADQSDPAMSVPLLERVDDILRRTDQSRKLRSV